MKKFYALCTLLLFISGFVSGQPTITHNGNAPDIGDTYHFSINEEALDPGPAGPNQTWDFSDFNVTSTATATIMAPGETPFQNDFPDCNQAFHYEGTSTYIFYDLTQNEMMHYGDAFDVSPPQIIHYTDQRKEIEYPFSFNNSFTDTWNSEFTYEGLTTRRSGTYVIIADAWGSLTTPEDTYNNVLRTKGVNSQIDSVWMDGNFIYATASLFTHYSWHTSSSHSPVMAITMVETNFGTSHSNHYTTSSANINERSEIENLLVFPNPALNEISISFDSYYVDDISIKVVDITGKIVINQGRINIFGVNHNLTLPLQNLSPGLYFLQIESDNTAISKKLIIE